MLMLFTSCSKDDKNIAVEGIILPKKIVIVDILGTKSNSVYTYNGAKIETVVSMRNYKEKYTYIGDKIIKIEGFQGNILDLTIDYIYENDKLKSTLFLYNDFNPQTGTAFAVKRKDVYTYNANGTVFKEIYFTDLITGIETNSNQTITYTFVEGNLIKEIRIKPYSIGNVSGINTYTFTFEYDNKNSPFKNIAGYNKFFSTNSSKNNVVRETTKTETTITGSAGITQSTEITNYILSYNSKDYLTEQKNANQSIASLEILVRQYNYE